MPKTIICSNPVDFAFLTEAAAQGDEILTEAIGVVLWKIVSQNAVAGGKTLSIPPDVIDEGRTLSRDPIRSYVATNGTIDMSKVETCASQEGSLSASKTLAADPNATAISVKAFGDAWREISGKLRRAGLVAGFAC
jgi:hypothetical protein